MTPFKNIVIKWQDQELFPHIAVEHNPRWKTEIILCGNDLVYSSLPTRSFNVPLY